MQILEGTSLAYYVALHSFCIALVFSIFVGYINSNWRKKADPKGHIATLMGLQMLSLVCLIYIAVVRSRTSEHMYLWGYFFSISWIVLTFLTVFCWCLFVEETNDTMLNRNVKRKYCWIIPALPVILVAVSSPVTHLLFSLENGGDYSRGPVFSAVIVTYNLYYAAIAVRSLIISHRSVYVDKRRMFLMFSIIPLMLMLSGFFRDYELSCMLHTLFAVIVFIFMARDSETKAHENLMGLAEEFSAVFMIDVDKDAIYSVAINDDRVLSAGSTYWRRGYKDTINAIISLYISPEEQSFTLEEFEGDKIIERLRAVRTFTKTFRVNGADGTQRYYSIIFARCDTPKKRRFTMGIRNIDELTRSRIRRDETLKGIAADYDAVLYVDTLTMRAEERYVLNPAFEHVLPKWDDPQQFADSFALFIATHVASEDRERFKRENSGEYVMEHLEKKNSYICNFKMIANGNIIYYQLKYIAKKQDDKLVGVVLGFKNVDEERRKELAVEVENGVRSDIINVLAYEYSVLFFGNLDNKVCNVVYVSDQMALARGRDKADSMDEVYERYIMNAVHPDERDEVAKAFVPKKIRSLLNGKKRFTLVVRCKFDDDYKYYELVVAKSEDADKDARNIAIGLAEIDREYRAKLDQELRLKNALAEADASSNAKSTFLFNMSHDIRTPLNAITGFTELAFKHIKEPEIIADYLSKINLSGKHLLKLVNEVLDMSRIESGKITSEAIPTTMLTIADDVVNICKESARDKGVLLKLRSEGVSNRTILADDLHVRQILMNIIGNSIKYTPEGGSITFKVREVTSRKAGYAKYNLSVSDTGKGMSEEYLSHIFEYFSQERNSNSTGIEGTGLGMAIVKRLVDFLEGKIDIKSEPEKGTTVTVVLQFPVQTLKSLSGEEQADVEISLAGKRILIVEDNELNREIAVEVMKANKLKTSVAVNGQEAVDIISKKGAAYFDFVLMDIQMPVMNGYESTAAIRKLPGGEDIKIIALSANAFEEDRLKSQSAGMNDHVAKPINTKELMRTLRKYAR